MCRVVDLVFLEQSEKIQRQLLRTMGNKTRRLLCVEDHIETCELITSTLRDFDVVSVTTKSDALERVRSGRFDLIVVDFYFPAGTRGGVCNHKPHLDQTTPEHFLTP